jgi:hypothetical protein
MPFAGILSNNKFGIIAYITIIIFTVSLFFFKTNKSQINVRILFYILFMLFILLLSFLYQLLIYDYNNIYYIQFFGSQMLFFLIFIFFANINKLNYTYMETFFKYMVILIFISVIIDYILLSNGLLTYQLMYKEYASSYHGKPLGLFGQFSINSAYIIVFYMLYKSKQINPNINNNYILFIMVTITIILQNSGTGYIAYLILLSVISYRYSVVKYILFPMALVGLIYIISNNIVTKISYEYLLYTYQYFEKIILVTYFQNINNFGDVVFGIDGNYHFPIDFGSLFLIAKVGLLYFVLYSVAIIYLIYNNKNNYFRMAILVLLISNIHYPALYYPVMNILLPILAIYTINHKKGKLEKNNISI